MAKSDFIKIKGRCVKTYTAADNFSIHIELKSLDAANKLRERMAARIKYSKRFMPDFLTNPESLIVSCHTKYDIPVKEIGSEYQYNFSDFTPKDGTDVIVTAKMTDRSLYLSGIEAADLVESKGSEFNPFDEFDEEF